MAQSVPQVPPQVPLFSYRLPAVALTPPLQASLAVKVTSGGQVLVTVAYAADKRKLAVALAAVHVDVFVPPQLGNPLKVNLRPVK